eukprot:5879050-Lingulodinium_polyedra.AAC.1
MPELHRLRPVLGERPAAALKAGEALRQAAEVGAGPRHALFPKGAELQHSPGCPPCRQVRPWGHAPCSGQQSAQGPFPHGVGLATVKALCARAALHCAHYFLPSLWHPRLVDQVKGR